MLSLSIKKWRSDHAKCGFGFGQTLFQYCTHCWAVSFTATRMWDWAQHLGRVICFLIPSLGFPILVGFLITFSLFSLPFWMRLLWLMRGPDLSYSTLKAGKWANLGLRIESDVKAIVSTLFRVSSCLGHGALCMCQCTHTQCFENDSFKCTYLLWRTV